MQIVMLLVSAVPCPMFMSSFFGDIVILLKFLAGGIGIAGITALYKKKWTPMKVDAVNNTVGTAHSQSIHLYNVTTNHVPNTVPNTVPSTVPSKPLSSVPSRLPSRVPSKLPSAVPSRVPSTAPSSSSLK